jgi:Mitochondrial glycoprotein
VCSLSTDRIFNFSFLPSLVRQVGVQEEFEKFLQERGINESLALFIPEYVEYKE